MSKDKPKGGLGKGLDILFGTSAESSEGNITELTAEQNIPSLEIKQIRTNPYQPRKDFDESELAELAESIKQKGVIQAVTVRKLNDGTYELISGERRLRAAKIAGLEKIPAYVIEVNTKEDILEIALIENLQRSDLNPIEIAEAYKKLITECSLTQEEVADKVGKSRSSVTNTLRLLTLPEEIQQSIKKGEITEGHARALLSVESDVDRMLLWKKIINENLSVRKVEEYSKQKKSKRTKKFSGKTYYINSQNQAEIRFLEEKFMEHFGTRVRLIPTSPTTGKIEIEYFTAEDLERIIELCKK
ncbi:MAG: ParB/RepB/Spo0J family partition protein [Ignavibacteria bacterium]|nr:ParB/RepB/Spo0J family partition protein [Ignavibacteria bacterium]